MIITARDVTIAGVATVIASVVGAASAVGVGWFGYASKEAELRVHLVEVGLGILRADPKNAQEAGVVPARQWAIDLVQDNSGRRFSAEERAALLKQPIVAPVPSSGLAAVPNLPMTEDDVKRLEAYAGREIPAVEFEQKRLEDIRTKLLADTLGIAKGQPAPAPPK